MPNKKTQIELIPAKTFEIKENCKYLLVFPIGAELQQLNNALIAFFGEKKVLAIAAKDPSTIKILELFEGEE